MLPTAPEFVVGRVSRTEGQELIGVHGMNWYMTKRDTKNTAVIVAKRRVTILTCPFAVGTTAHSMVEYRGSECGVDQEVKFNSKHMNAGN